jgi:hypothetical protein
VSNLRNLMRNSITISNRFPFYITNRIWTSSSTITLNYTIPNWGRYCSASARYMGEIFSSPARSITAQEKTQASMKIHLPFEFLHGGVVWSTRRNRKSLLLCCGRSMREGEGALPSSSGFLCWTPVTTMAQWIVWVLIMVICSLKKST